MHPCRCVVAGLFFFFFNLKSGPPGNRLNMSCSLLSSLGGCHQHNQVPGGLRRLIGKKGGYLLQVGWGELIWPLKLARSVFQPGCHCTYQWEQPFSSLSDSFPVWACLRNHYHIYRATWPHGTRMRGLERPIYFSSCAAILGGEAGGGEGRAPILALEGQRRINCKGWLERNYALAFCWSLSCNWLECASVASLGAMYSCRSLVDHWIGTALKGQWQCYLSLLP